MRKLALNDEILLKIDKPARYIGGEINAVMKDPKEVDIRFAMCFPDVYEIGMSHLGIQILYDMFNRREDVWCERVYSPWVDLDRIMREKKIPLFALESQDPVKEFDFLGITIQYEMCYTNILQVLDLSGIPLCAAERMGNMECRKKEARDSGRGNGFADFSCTPDGQNGSVDEASRREYPPDGQNGFADEAALGWEYPLVIGGGPCAYNPEPIAEFFDLFYIGEGETIYDELLDLYKTCRREGCSRREFLLRASALGGIYVPGLYETTYKEDGTIAFFEPICEGVPRTIEKQVVTDMTSAPYPEAPIVPFIKVTQDRVVLEIQRGCIRGCRFCQAGMLYRPTRERSLECLKEHAYKMLKNTGHEEISLSSLSSSDYSELPGIVNFLIDEFRSQNINISLPSLRIDAFSLDVMGKVQDVRKSSLTFAPEAGSQRLRDVINKGLTKEVILQGADEAFHGGWNKVKLYFMLGLPTETEEDRRDIAHLANDIAVKYYEIPKDQRNGKCQITVSTSFFVPKPFTPFQWARMYTPGDYLGFAKTVNREIKEMLNQKSIRYNWHQADVTLLEGVLARGDRRIAAVIKEAYRLGSLYDAWTEYWDYGRWLQAFENTGIDMDFYTLRERPIDEIFPWDFIQIGVTRDFLEKEWKKAQEETVTPNCRNRCSACGAGRYKTGVCTEKRTAAVQNMTIQENGSVTAAGRSDLDSRTCSKKEVCTCEKEQQGGALA